jgi:4-azaleucine resistance transporter AzlC
MMDGAVHPEEPRFTAEGVRTGFLRLLPLAVMIIPFGIAFGVTSVEVGVPNDAALLMSAAIFAGASQFAVLDLWGDPLPVLSMVAVVLTVNARHIVMGAAIGPKLRGLNTSRQLLAVSLLSDANFADAQSAWRSGHEDAAIVLGGGIALWICWMVGSGIGIAMSGAMVDPARFGFDVTMAAFFTAMLVGNQRTGGNLAAGLIGAAIALVSAPVVPSGWEIILGALAAGCTAFFRLT